MKIRSITAFTKGGPDPEKWALDELAFAVSRAKEAFEQEGLEVQTLRLATRPFPSMMDELEEVAAIEFVQAAERVCKGQPFDYVSLGPAQVERPESFALIPAMLAKSENSFFSGMMTRNTAISAVGIRGCADVIRQAADIEANGFANLRFAALANVAGGSPFFPAAYQEQGSENFAIGTQAADLAVEAFRKAKSLQDGAERLRSLIENHAKIIAKIAERVSEESGIRFGGIDFSLAPFPEEKESLGTAFEAMGVPAVGMQSSLTAAAVLTSAIEEADFPKVGFNGLLLPPLEDARLAQRAAEGVLNVSDLLLYSAVCGTGLDTIPLPGDSSSEQMGSILMDVAALSQRLNKALTARLMPIPGKKAGDKTEFDFDFFANSSVMGIDQQAAGGFLAENADIAIHRRVQKD